MYISHGLIDRYFSPVFKNMGLAIFALFEFKNCTQVGLEGVIFHISNDSGKMLQLTID